jgi:hypothetical protein
MQQKPVQQTMGSQQTAPQQTAYRPMNRDVQINIPDFLKNKR